MAGKYIALRSHDGSGVVASIISNGTYGEVNHSSIEFVNDRLVVEAHAKAGVRVRAVETDGKNETVHRFVFVVSDEEYAEARTFAQAQNGKPYDKAAIIRFIPGIRRLVKADREESGRWICSELAEQIMRKANIPTQRRDILAETVDPVDQFKSGRCDLTMPFGPVMYERIVKGAIIETKYALPNKAA
jgi:hypothetical protein